MLILSGCGLHRRRPDGPLSAGKANPACKHVGTYISTPVHVYLRHVLDTYSCTHLRTPQPRPAGTRRRGVICRETLAVAHDTADPALRYRLAPTATTRSQLFPRPTGLPALKWLSRWRRSPFLSPQEIHASITTN